MPNINLNQRGNLNPNSRSYDYSSFCMTPSTSYLSSTPLIYSLPLRTTYLHSTLNPTAVARSNLAMSFGNKCNSPFYKVNEKGALLPVPVNTLINSNGVKGPKGPKGPNNDTRGTKSGTRSLAIDTKGNYYISHFGKNYKVKFGKNGRYFNYGKQKIFF